MSATNAEPLSKVYVWQWPIRVIHWTIVLSIILLGVTGVYIGHPFLTSAGDPRTVFTMGWMRALHFWGAIAFTAAIVARFVFFFTGNEYARIGQFLSLSKERREGFLPTLAFYLWLRKKPPAYVGHNPMAGGAYLAIFGLCAIEILTGLALFGASAGATWTAPFARIAVWVGGLMIVRWIHHVILYLLVGFAVQHVYSSVLMSSIEGNGTLDSIFTGWKFVDPKHVKDKNVVAAKP